MKNKTLKILLTSLSMLGVTLPLANATEIPCPNDIDLVSKWERVGPGFLKFEKYPPKAEINFNNEGFKSCVYVNLYRDESNLYNASEVIDCGGRKFSLKYKNNADRVYDLQKDLRINSAFDKNGRSFEVKQIDFNIDSRCEIVGNKERDQNIERGDLRQTVVRYYKYSILMDMFSSKMLYDFTLKATSYLFYRHEENEPRF